MIQIRYNTFETNSSSASVFYIRAYQIEDIDIPTRVDIDSSDGESHLGNAYQRAKDNKNKLFGYLHYIGVKEIYVDGKLVTESEECKDPSQINSWTEFFNDSLPAYLFGDWFSCSEWESWGEDLYDYYEDENHSLSNINYKDVKKVEQYAKNPKYKVLVYGNFTGDDEEITFDRFKEEFTKRYPYRVAHPFTIIITFLKPDTIDMKEFSNKLSIWSHQFIIDEKMRKFIYDKGYPMFEVDDLAYTINNNVLTITGSVYGDRLDDFKQVVPFRRYNFEKFYKYDVANIDVTC